jgi:hypothetical protein
MAGVKLAVVRSDVRRNRPTAHEEAVVLGPEATEVTDAEPS